MVQTRIDTDPSCKAGKNAVHFVGQQAKWFHAEAIPEHKANSPYFINAFRETQNQDHDAPKERRTTHTGIGHQGLHPAYWTLDSSNERQSSSSPLLPYVSYPVGEVTQQPMR